MDKVKQNSCQKMFIEIPIFHYKKCVGYQRIDLAIKQSNIFFSEFLIWKIVAKRFDCEKFGAKTFRKFFKTMMTTSTMNKPSKMMYLDSPTASVIDWTIFILKETAGVRIRSGKSRATHFLQLSSRHRSRLISCSPILSLLAPILLPSFFKKSSDHPSYRVADKTNPQSYSQTGVFTKTARPIRRISCPTFSSTPENPPKLQTPREKKVSRCVLCEFCSW